MLSSACNEPSYLAYIYFLGKNVHSCCINICYLYFVFQNGEEFVKKVKGVFCFKVKKDNKEGVWVVDVKNGKGSVKFDPAGKRV